MSPIAPHRAVAADSLSIFGAPPSALSVMRRGFWSLRAAFPTRRHSPATIILTRIPHACPFPIRLLGIPQSGHRPALERVGAAGNFRVNISRSRHRCDVLRRPAPYHHHRFFVSIFGLPPSTPSVKRHTRQTRVRMLSFYARLRRHSPGLCASSAPYLECARQCLFKFWWSRDRVHTVQVRHARAPHHAGSGRTRPCSDALSDVLPPSSCDYRVGAVPNVRAHQFN
ncbi:hypothetical protein B0H15DRAFT_953384 [Mycena belliarum]|uniref:Uncharacterized protein n=1 Tax=Mycena belliarum TaxID=1033014 RepID=A0AAD6XIA6_9AGAR|nr:hypothetical protein B0H15DRAFT_953384 [Mycena belliae]